ncbi:hypothetical protein JCM16303_006047 [Sporobolomyces ruberrimus]
MSHSTLPLLPPPPPRFPHTFSSSEGPESVANGITTSYRDMDEEEEEPSSGGRAGNPPTWHLKTDAEQHVQNLEDKLARLSKLQQQGRVDSPVRPPELAEPDLAQLKEYERDSTYDFGTGERENPGSQGDEGEAAGHEDEGRALISIAEDEAEGERTTASGVTDGEEDNEADLSGNEDETTRTYRSPHPFQSLTAAQRISFSNSVRISGGIHTKPHRHRVPKEMFPRRSPSTERSNPIPRDPRPETAPSPLLVASVTSSSANTPSRATSPSGRHPSHPSLGVLAPKPRRLSSSSHLSSGFNLPSFSYSASPGSQVPSRGSSPCSSIYAPLQPPSKHTPNPLFVRPAPRLQRQTSGSSGLSFQEYLREGYDAFENSDDDDSDVGRNAPRSPGYRELVEQQRRKRAQWEERKRRRIEDKRRKLHEQDLEGGRGEATNKGFWHGVKQFFAVGAATSPTGHFGATGAGRAGGSFGSSTVFRGSSRLPTNANYGATMQQKPVASPPVPAPKPRSILTSAQQPPVSSAPSRPKTRGPRSSKPPPPPSSRAKSEVETRFGSAPFRYFSLAFILYKLQVLVDAVKDLFSTASKGLAKQKERERLASRSREEGYQAV